MVGEINTRHAISGTSPEALAHNAGNNGIGCESCHTVSNWFGAIYNHVGATGTCFTCHNGVRATPATPVTGTSSEAFAHNSQNAGTGVIDCAACHKGYSNWLGALYSHSGTGYSGACSTCHNSSRATGFTQAKITYPTHVTSGECDSCHSTTTWAGALGVMPSYHIPFNAGVACGACHIGAPKVAIGTLHTYSSTSTCAVCHITPNAYSDSRNNIQTKSTHKGSSGSNCSNCHKRASTYVDWSE
jgi:hypothetical protein